MKKNLIIIVLLALSQSLFSQEWTVEIDLGCTWGLNDMVTVDGGESVLGIGNAEDDGFLVKIDKDGEYINRVVHLPGMILEYYSAVQLDNGNFMVFGLCDDSLCDPHFRKCLRVDIYDGELETVGSRMYDVEDETYETFSYGNTIVMLKSILSPSGTVILAASPAFYDEIWGNYRRALQMYELDRDGNILVKKPDTTALVNSFRGITYEPHSDNLLVAVNGGSFPNVTGAPGMYVIDMDFNVVGRQHLLGVQGGYGYEVDCINSISIDGTWIDGENYLLQALKFERNRPSFCYSSLYKVDSALHVYGELHLPPHDSCTWLPEGTGTAYIDDSTIFAFTFCAESMASFDTHQTNVILVDKHLNLLGRKTLKQDHVLTLVGQTAPFNDGGCVVRISKGITEYYQGEPFSQFMLMKFRRDDIEITWDVVRETTAVPVADAYPNPTSGTINIACSETFAPEDRILVFDLKGVKCLDSAVGSSGNLIRLDLQNLESGMYSYKVVSGRRELAVGKFVKE